MQRVAMGWLVYRLTNSAFLLGVVGFTCKIPIFILTLFAGVLADRLDRHRMLVITQTLAMMQALTLASGFGLMVQHASGNTILQAVVDEDKRGRVMSLFGMSFRGVLPFGSLLGGTLASRIGAPKTVLLGGMCCVVGALLLAKILPSMTEMIRSACAKKGFLAEN